MLLGECDRIQPMRLEASEMMSAGMSEDSELWASTRYWLPR